MIHSSGTECRRYLSTHYLTPKCVLLLTFFNSVAEGVVVTDNCADRTSETAGFHSVDAEVSGLPRSLRSVAGVTYTDASGELLLQELRS
jgi:hypothetical protein